MRHMRKLMAVVMLAGGLWTVVTVGASARAGHPCPMERASEAELRAAEGELLGHLNRERTARGMGSIAVDGRIADVARGHARRMAAEGRVYHNPEYRDASRYDAAYIDEVVTNDCSAHGAHENFMGSPSHRGALLTAGWTHGGIGVGSDEAGMLFVVEAFAQRKAPPAPAPPAPVQPPPAPVSAPAVEATPASTPEAARTPVPTPSVAPTPSEVAVGLAPVGFERVDVPEAPEVAAASVGTGDVGVGTAGWSVALLLQWGLLLAVFGPGGPRKRRTHRPEPVGSTDLEVRD